MPATLSAQFAPTGALRASINLGNPLLARCAANGQPEGVSIDLAREWAKRLGVGLELCVFDKAADSVQAVRDEQADIGFFAIDPARSDGISFTAPYLLIEGSYLVREGSPLHSNDEVDRPGNRVVVGAGSAYDFFLSRTLQAATLVRAASSQTVVATFLEAGAEVAAGVRQPLEAEARRSPGLRLLPGRFMLIQQAMGCPQGRGDAPAVALRGFVDEMKASGYVAEALLRHGVTGASVAP